MTVSEEKLKKGRQRYRKGHVEPGEVALIEAPKRSSKAEKELFEEEKIGRRADRQ